MDVIEVRLPVAGEIGVGVGPEDEDGFRSVVWFPADQLADAEELAEESPGWVVKEGVAF